MSERYTFTDIFDKELDLKKDIRVRINKIIIPKIQRPYAQGRTDGICTYVRNTLLNEIFENFTTDDFFDFNFIYGIIRSTNNEYVMELLDGQQRMTTLFLIYWYIANRELSEDDKFDKEIRNCLNSFMYETRSTSTVFCQKLSLYHVDLDDEIPSKKITKAKWYFKSFDKDSTIRAMLTMLDAIHNKYNKQTSKELHKKLSNIQFYVKSLGYFNLSDELYIKMNARGLQLSPFENFKADLTNFIFRNNYNGFQQDVSLYKKNCCDKVPFHFNFSVKLDAKWIDIFWKQGDESFDASYMSFFTRFFACKYIISSKDKVTDRDIRQDEILHRLYTDAEDHHLLNEYYGFQDFNQILTEHPQYILTLDKVLDVIHEYDYLNQDKLIYKSMLPQWEKNNEKDGDDFYYNINAKMTHVKLIALSALIEFVEAYDLFDIEIYKQWMRVVWNIIENTNIDSLTPVSSLIRKMSSVINSVAKYGKSEIGFYSALVKWRDDYSDERENRALIEEIVKASLISKDNNWLDVFIEAENHPFFKGMVMFFYTDGITINEYKKRYDVVKNMFDVNGITESYKEKHIFIRSIISQFTTWGELREQYVTEKSETNKYLKNILASNDNVRYMIANVADCDKEESVKTELASYIENAKNILVWDNGTDIEQEYLNFAVNRLRYDIKLYDWITTEWESHKYIFRIYYYEGHIMFAVPKKQYAKVALDTERAKIANKIADIYCFNYADQNQLSMYNEYNDCFGNDLWLYQERHRCKLWVGFCQHHEIKIQVECDTIKYANEILNNLKDNFSDNCFIMDGYDRRVSIPCEINHFKYKNTYNNISSFIENVFDNVPEAQ